MRLDEDIMNPIEAKRLKLYGSTKNAKKWPKNMGLDFSYEKKKRKTETLLERRCCRSNYL